MPSTNGTHRIAKVRVLVRREFVMLKAGNAAAPRPVEKWVAQCLEQDIVAQGETWQLAVLSFQRIYVGLLTLGKQNNRDYIGKLPSVPPEVEAEFEAAKKPDRRITIEVKIEWPDEEASGVSASQLPEIEAALELTAACA
jgi:hypothetical protein